jgi:hypothetical protein
MTEVKRSTIVIALSAINKNWLYPSGRHANGPAVRMSPLRFRREFDMVLAPDRPDHYCDQLAALRALADDTEE